MGLSAMYKTLHNATLEKVISADQFGSISLSQKLAINQIKKAKLGLRKCYKVLDLGVGNGEFSKRLQQIMPTAKFTGIDISKTRLQKAKKELSLVAIEGNAMRASQYLPHNSQDLVLAHFINAYIPVESLFNEANLLTRSNGHFSLITTTYESFPKAQQHLAEFIAQGSLLARVIGHYYKSMANNYTVASGTKALNLTFEKHNFSIHNHHRLEIPIIIKNIDEMTAFALEGTWFLNSLSMRMLPKYFLFERLRRLFSQIFIFPYRDVHIIDVFLAKK